MSHTYYDKQASSRPIFTTTSTANMTKAGPQSYQLRVAATASGLICINDSSSTSAGNPVCVLIAAAAAGEYFAITPGQWYLPAANMSVTEVS